MEKNSKIGAIIQARVYSTRLPKKMLIRVQGKTILEHVIERVKKGDPPQEVEFVDDYERVLRSFNDVYGKISQLGHNQMMVMGNRWGECLEILDRIETKIQEMPRPVFQYPAGPELNIAVVLLGLLADNLRFLTGYLNGHLHLLLACPANARTLEGKLVEDEQVFLAAGLNGVDKAEHMLQVLPDFLPGVLDVQGLIGRLNYRDSNLITS